MELWIGGGLAGDGSGHGQGAIAPYFLCRYAALRARRAFGGVHTIGRREWIYSVCGVQFTPPRTLRAAVGRPRRTAGHESYLLWDADRSWPSRSRRLLHSRGARGEDSPV